MKTLAIILCQFFLINLNIAQTLSFIQPSGSPISNTNNQRGIISVDLNGDSFKDLIIASPNNNSIRVLLGSGNGQFTNAPGSPITVASGPIYIAVSDFNGDSKLDLVTANYFSDNVTILLGNGLGSFIISSSINIGNYPYCVAVEDFNLDGAKDLVTCSTNGNNIHILYGNGVGSFSLAAGFPMAAGGGPYHVVTGFFNGDIFPDFAVANGNGSFNTVSVFMGTALGTFTAGPGSPYSTGQEPRTIAIKDLNNDGFSDMVVTNAQSSNLNILLGSSSGVFSNAPGSPVSTGSIPYQSVIADFDLNGTMDIISTSTSGNSLTILTGNGNGTFNPFIGSAIAVGSNPQPICSDDFDGDGRIDLAVGHWTDNTIRILLNKSDDPCNLLCSFTHSTGTAGFVNFISTSTGTAVGVTYSWNYGDASPTGVGTTSSHTYLNSGTYTVILTANNNVSPACVSSATQALKIEVCNVVGSFIHALAINGAVNFTSTSTGTTVGTTYSWNYGDASLSGGGSTTSHAYLNAGTYSVTLTVNNNSSPVCMSSITHVIAVEAVAVGVADLSVLSSVNIFPNPSSGIIYVIIDDLKNGTMVVVYNYVGVEQLRRNLLSNKTLVDVTSLHKGVYYYQLVTNKKVIKAGKFLLE